jgi:hypothetical protein
LKKPGGIIRAVLYICCLTTQTGGTWQHPRCRRLKAYSTGSRSGGCAHSRLGLPARSVCAAGIFQQERFENSGWTAGAVEGKTLTRSHHLIPSIAFDPVCRLSSSSCQPCLRSGSPLPRRSKSFCLPVSSCRAVLDQSIDGLGLAALLTQVMPWSMQRCWR